MFEHDPDRPLTALKVAVVLVTVNSGVRLHGFPKRARRILPDSCDPRKANQFTTRRCSVDRHNIAVLQPGLPPSQFDSLFPGKDLRHELGSDGQE